MLFYMLAHMVLHQLYEVLPKCMSCASQLSQCRCLSMQPATSGWMSIICTNSHAALHTRNYVSGLSSYIQYGQGISN